MSATRTSLRSEVEVSWLRFEVDRVEPAPNHSSDLRFVSDSLLGRFRSDLDFGEFQRLEHGLWLSRTRSNRYRS